MQDQHIIIIGGSSGIGLATAKAAVRAGARVTITGTSEASVQAARLQLPGASAHTLRIQDEAAVQAFFALYDRLDHVFVAAGSTFLGGILDANLSEALAAINLRIAGSLYAVRAAAPSMRERGSFLFTGGLSTDRPIAGAWASGIGTAAAEQLARVLALELPHLRFNALSPGYTDTPMWHKVLGEQKEAVLAEAVANFPIARLVTPEEVAQGALLLMQNEAITGEVLHLDGGARLV